MVAVSYFVETDFSNPQWKMYCEDLKAILNIFLCYMFYIIFTLSWIPAYIFFSSVIAQKQL